MSPPLSHAVLSREAAARFLREEASFMTHLKAKGLKSTPERLEVLREIFGRENHFAIEDVAQALRRHGRPVSRATVYRTLSLLAETGLIREAVRGNGYIHYEHVRESEHHDHLLCVHCGAVVEFVNAQVERIQDEICRRHGFTPLSHTHQINGLCGRCEGKRSRRVKGRRVRQGMADILRGASS
jgi:Fur family ferric uptake transcriptional regulator